MPRLSELGLLRTSKPDEWVRRITRALRRSRGFLDPAAEELDVSRRTLQRWIHEDDLLEDVRALVAKPAQTREARKPTALGALRIAKPNEWVRDVSHAVRAANGNLHDAAEQLGISRRLLQKWVHDDERLARVRALVVRSYGK